MVEESPYETRRIERNELVQGAVRQALFGQRRGRHRARGDQHGEILRPQPFDERHRGEHFADAGAMHPNQRTMGTLQGRFAAAFGQTLGMFLAAIKPSRQNLRRHRRSGRGCQLIKPQRQRHTTGHVQTPRWFIDEFVGPPRRRIEPLLEPPPRRFERCVVGVARHAQRLGGDAGAAAKRQIDRGAVPIVEHDAAARGDGARIDRPARGLRELDDAQARRRARLSARRPTARSSFLRRANRASPGTRRRRLYARSRRRDCPSRGWCRRRAVSAATALISPSRCRDTSIFTRCSILRATGASKCCPCQNANMIGISASPRS